MGCKTSKHKFVPNIEIPGQSEGCRAHFAALGLEQVDVDNLFHAFREMDVHNSGFVRPIELFTYFGIELTGLEIAIFNIFDDEKTGKLHFFELAVMLWDFLSFHEEALGIYIYLMKDPTGVMRIKYPDVKEVMELIHRRKVEASPALQVLFNDAKARLSAEISLNDFAKWASYNPSLLSPLLIVQLKIKKLLCGEKFWLKHAERRASNAEQSRADFTKRLHSIIKKVNGDENYQRHQIEREKKVQSMTSLTESQKNIARKQSVLLAAFNMKQPSSGQVLPAAESSMTSGGSAIDKAKSKKKLDVSESELDSPINASSISKKEKSKSSEGSKKTRPSSANKKSSGNNDDKDSKKPALVKEDSKKGNFVKEESKKANLAKEESKKGSLSKEESKRGGMVKEDSKRGTLVKEDSKKGILTKEGSKRISRDEKKSVSISDDNSSPKKNKSDRGESKAITGGEASTKRSTSKRNL